MLARLTSALLLWFALGSPAAVAHDEAFDAGWTAAERRAGLGLKLTMVRIRQLAVIGRGLRELSDRHPQTCRWMNQIVGPETLARQARALDDYSTVHQIIESASMSAQGYLLALYAVSETAIAVHDAAHGVDTTASASPANISFYEANREAIETMLDEPEPCEGATLG